MTYSIPGPSVMLMGETGAGKTYSIRTLLDCGIQPFVLFTDPGMGVITDVAGDPSQGCKIHWAYIPPYNPGFDVLIDAASKINKLSPKALADMPDMDKNKYAQFIDLYTCLSNFKCDRCGNEFGAVDSWDVDKAIVVDNLSGVSRLAMDMVAGGKPVKSQQNWGTAMSQVENFALKFSTGIRAWSVLISHMEHEVDEVSGTTRLMASTLGRKLSPKLPRTFDEVIEAYRVGDDFWWSSSSTKAATKSRYLPMQGKLDPSFLPLFEIWQKAGGRAA